MAQKEKTPIYTFPGITIENFWSEIALRQRGRFPWTIDEIQEKFQTTKNAFDRMHHFNTKKLMDLASFILHHINSNICPSSMRTRQLRPKGPSSPPRPVRCQTPKARRTCVQCETLLNDVDDTYLCPNCIHFRK